MEGDFATAQREVEQGITERATQVYLTPGDLYIDMHHIGTPENTVRSLDISKAVHTVEYDADGIHYTRTAFIS